MFNIKDKEFPLKRLINIRNRISYQLSVRTEDGKVGKLMCEFQTQSDFVFSAASQRFQLHDKVWVRTNTLTGSTWQACVVSYIESHGDFALFQMSLRKN